MLEFVNLSEADDIGRLSFRGGKQGRSAFGCFPHVPKPFSRHAVAGRKFTPVA